VKNVNISETNKYIRILVYISGVLTLISILTPVRYITQAGYGLYEWMWGLYYYDYSGGSEFDFFSLEEPLEYRIPIFLSNMIPAIIIFVCSLALINKAQEVRVGRRKLADIANELIGSGILLILAPIIYNVAYEFTVNLYLDHINAGYNFELWTGDSPGFAFIGPFIGGGLAVICGVIAKVQKPKEEPIVKPVPIATQAPFTTQREPVRAITPRVAIDPNVRYCPECGQKLTSTVIKYCPSCGIELHL